ncbi:MAG: HAD family phosphatase [Lutimonas sp.]
MPRNRIDNIVFDLGGVLVDWDPKYLYRKVFDNDNKRIDAFLSEVCTPEWNIEQDAGRSLSEATQILVEKFPEEEVNIRLFYDRWEEMIRGEVKGTVTLLDAINKKGAHNLYALTNWSAETFPVAQKRFDFLTYFQGIVVSGDEKTRKPFPRIYEILFERYGLDPTSSIFIDDSLPHVVTARELGMTGIQFKHPKQLDSDLRSLGALY